MIDRHEYLRPSSDHTDARKWGIVRSADPPGLHKTRPLWPIETPNPSPCCRLCVLSLPFLDRGLIVHESGCELLADSEVFIQVCRGPDESDGAWLLLAWNLNNPSSSGVCLQIHRTLTFFVYYFNNEKKNWNMYCFLFFIAVLILLACM